MAEDPTLTEDEAGVESLIQGRAKRSTAGRHMSALLDAEADDDLALLFEEIEDDNEFSVAAEEDGGEEDDMGLDSSSDDDDDQGPNAQDGEFEGEQEIQKEAVAERKKRRAHEDLRMKTFRKKVKVDPTAVSAVPAAAPRPKKKSERISWLPTVEDGPTRSSSRRQTMHNKELTHAKLKDSEEKRIRLIATMEAAAKRKAQFKPKVMTQAERLAEAEKVERHNSKTLNRWEEMEKRKAEERLAKIEALQNRRLEGPVMSYWSGLATWADGRLTRVGKVDITQKPEKEENARKKSKKTEKEDKDKKTLEQKPVAETPPQPANPPTTDNATESAAKEPAASGEGEAVKLVQEQSETKQENVDSIQQPIPENGTEPNHDNMKPAPDNTTAPAAATKSPPVPTAPEGSTPEAKSAPSTEPVSDAGPPPTTDEAAKEKDTAEGTATEETPKEKEPTAAGEAKPAEDLPKESPKDPNPDAQQASEASDKAPKPELEQQKSELALEQKEDAASKESGAEPSTAAQNESTPAAQEPPAAASSTATPAPATQQGETPAPSQQEAVAPEVQMMDIDQPATTSEITPQPQVPPPPAVIEQTGRNLTILENFDDKTAQSREYSIYFNAKKPPRLTKISSSLCVITSLPSRYRDPDTSLPFANAYAHREIQRAAEQRFSWSTMLGCYIGPAGVAARGVPARFLGGDQAEEKDKEGEEGDNRDKESTAVKDKEGKEGDKEGGDKAAIAAAPATPAAPSTAPATPAPTATGTAPPGSSTTPVAAGGDDPMDVDK